MSQEIRDDAAIAFATGFYRALGYGRSIELSYKFGCNQIQLIIPGSGNSVSRSVVSEEQRKLEVADVVAARKVIPEHLKPILLKKANLTIVSDSAVSRPDDNISPATQVEMQLNIDRAVGKEMVLKQYREVERLRQEQEDDLSSEKGVDYTQLRDLLKAGQWKEADWETLNVMLKVAGRVSEGWLDSQSIENFPCTDLRTIDLLWVKYSEGRFGFSVQKKIWQEVNPDHQAFGDRVGWRKRKGWFTEKEWLYYNDLTFSLEAPKGNLPLAAYIPAEMRALPWGGDWGDDAGIRFGWWGFFSLSLSLSRRDL